MFIKLSRNCIIKRFITNHHRLLSSSKILNEGAQSISRKNKNKPESVKVSKDVVKHFDTPYRSAAFDFPKSLMLKKRKKSNDVFYVADKLAASKIIKEFKKDLPANKPILEINPGIGLLTKYLIQDTPNDLFLYENDASMYDELLKIVEKNENRNISMKECDFVSLWKLGYLDKLDDGSRVEQLFENIQRKEFDDDTTARLFACVGSIKFFKDLINSVVFQNGIMSIGRSEMYLVVPPPIFLNLTCSPTAGYFLYRGASILFQLLFEYRFIAKFDRKYFLPWRCQPTNSPKLGKILLTDFDYMYFIKVVPRQNLFQFCLPHQLPALWFFIKQHLYSRTKQVIPTMERWIPGCGPRLIVNAKPSKKPEILYPDQKMDNIPKYLAPCTTLSMNDYCENINIFTQFGSLTPTQIFTVFNQFINWPEYESCAYVDMLEKALIKMHTKPEELDDDLEETHDEIVDPVAEIPNEHQ